MSARRLVVGERIVLNDGVYVVEKVNACRARVVPERRRHVEYETVDGKRVEFEAHLRGLDISPYSIVERA